MFLRSKVTVTFHCPSPLLCSPHLTATFDVIKWKLFPRYWPFMRGIHRSPVNSQHKGQWRGALMFSFNYVWINGWVQQPWGWWSEMPSRSLWRQYNETLTSHKCVAAFGSVLVLTFRMICIDSWSIHWIGWWVGEQYVSLLTSLIPSLRGHQRM